MKEDKFFKIGLAMAEILSGKKEAATDLKLLLEEYPEMIDKVKDVAYSIQQIADKKER
ncbi:hypothetical protein L5F64_02095 [Aliarcobacter butzleri]|uniref:hypothetical protein n=1 Tax=Aliarcobacter butzleri TaxID=28197 RepID=UPI001EDAA5A8|nr:hypothetical protein [Aliarcobacter butzleri]MCG3711001.1 hypothetical protein [Aliarcobacter butzleri]MCG3714355.1 hypothetical protein [Aliarcobacter butzleri]